MFVYTYIFNLLHRTIYWNNIQPLKFKIIGNPNNLMALWDFMNVTQMIWHEGKDNIWPMIILRNILLSVHSSCLVIWLLNKVYIPWHLQSPLRCVPRWQIVGGSSISMCQPNIQTILQCSIDSNKFGKCHTLWVLKTVFIYTPKHRMHIVSIRKAMFSSLVKFRYFSSVRPIPIPGCHTPSSFMYSLYRWTFPRTEYTWQNCHSTFSRQVNLRHVFWIIRLFLYSALIFLMINTMLYFN